MSGPIARIILRYLSGAMVAKGILSADDAMFLNTDPDAVQLVTAGVGAVLALATEIFYRVARKAGWAL